jgi:hypothetical protein
MAAINLASLSLLPVPIFASAPPPCWRQRIRKLVPQSEKENGTTEHAEHADRKRRIVGDAQRVPLLEMKRFVLTQQGTAAISVFCVFCGSISFRSNGPRRTSLGCP